jgi:hypothetical protein
MLTWTKTKTIKGWLVKWSDGKSCIFRSEQKALEAINNRFFDAYF